MDSVLSYRGRTVNAAQVTEIKELMAEAPGLSRRALSQAVCRRWNWTQENGQLCDVLCRGLLLKLHRAGQIALPEPRWTSSKRRSSQVVSTPIAIDTTPLSRSLHELSPVQLIQVRRTSQEALICALIERYHYLGYVQPVGEHLKYLIVSGERPIACFCVSSAARHLGPRDRYIGWTPRARQANLRLIAYQSRFLILPWVRVPHLASHLLGRLSRQLSRDWERVYAHPIYFCETFVDPERYAGTCYRAANWTLLGQTTGRGKDDRTNRVNRSRKQVYGLALTKRFRDRLCVCS